VDIDRRAAALRVDRQTVLYHVWQRQRERPRGFERDEEPKEPIRHGPKAAPSRGAALGEERPRGLGAGGEQRRCLQTGLMFARPGRFNEIIFI
jgi:hypothetical protein